MSFLRNELFFGKNLLKQQCGREETKDLRGELTNFNGNDVHVHAKNSLTNFFFN